MSVHYHSEYLDGVIGFYPADSENHSNGQCIALHVGEIPLWLHFLFVTTAYLFTKVEDAVAIRSSVYNAWKAPKEWAAPTKEPANENET